jgi:hypothetical protein
VNDQSWSLFASRCFLKEIFAYGIALRMLIATCKRTHRYHQQATIATP